MALDDALRVEISVSSSAVVMALSGELDLGSAPVFSNELKRLDIAAQHPALVIDLSGLDFMDSTGLRAILSARERAIADRCDFAIVPGHRQVSRLLTIARIDEHVRFISSPAELAGKA